jgi:DNA-binding CsgD family transcriptional regulator
LAPSCAAVGNGDGAGTRASATDQAASVDTRLALQAALRAIPAGKRAVLVLRYLEDLPEAQVAQILGCSVGTVRSQTHRAIAQLRSVLPALGLTSTEVHACCVDGSARRSRFAAVADPVPAGGQVQQCPMSAWRPWPAGSLRSQLAARLGLLLSD